MRKTFQNRDGKSEFGEELERKRRISREWIREMRCRKGGTWVVKDMKEGRGKMCYNCATCIIRLIIERTCVQSVYTATRKTITLRFTATLSSNWITQCVFNSCSFNYKSDYSNTSLFFHIFNFRTGVLCREICSIWKEHVWLNYHFGHMVTNLHKREIIKIQVKCEIMKKCSCGIYI